MRKTSYISGILTTNQNMSADFRKELISCRAGGDNIMMFLFTTLPVLSPFPIL